MGSEVGLVFTHSGSCRLVGWQHRRSLGQHCPGEEQPPTGEHPPVHEQPFP